jgi:hypothetical protein
MLYYIYKRKKRKGVSLIRVLLIEVVEYSTADFIELKGQAGRASRQGPRAAVWVLGLCGFLFQEKNQTKPEGTNVLVFTSPVLIAPR